MRRLVFGVLRARPGQSAVLFLLAALAVAAGTAAPMYAAAAGRAVRLHELDAASGADRAISVAGSLPAADSLDRIGPVQRQLAGAVRGSGLTQIVSRDLRGQLDYLTPAPGGPGVTVTARDGVCAHLVLTGRCPRAAGEAVLGASTAQSLGMGVGDEIREVASLGLKPPLRLKVVGTYRFADTAEAYWAGRADIDDDPRRTDLPVFVTDQTLRDAKPQTLQVTVDLVALDAGTLAADPAPLRAAAAAARRAAPAGFQVTTRLPELATRIEDSERTLTSGVTVGAGQLILICGFVLLLAVGYAAVQRRAESGLAALRGAPTWHRVLLAVGPNALLLLAGAPVGFAVGWLAVAAGARLGFDDRVPVAVTGATYAVAGGTLLLVLGATVAAQWRVHSGTAARGTGAGGGGALLDALRHTPPRRRGWRGDLLDLVVVAVAAAAAYQVGSGAAAGGTDGAGDSPGGIVALTPILIALACGLVAGRLVLPVAVALGAAQLRRGRLASGMAALYLARRPQAHRLLALITIAIALLGQAVSGVDTSGRAAQARARLELGADRVLTVHAVSPAAVTAAVHAADPGGRWAMAVARQQMGAGDLLAVESDRLAAVAYWPSGRDAPPMSQVASALRPPTNPVVEVSGSELLLDVTMTAGDGSSAAAGQAAAGSAGAGGQASEPPGAVGQAPGSGAVGSAPGSGAVGQAPGSGAETQPGSPGAQDQAPGAGTVDTQPPVPMTVRLVRADGTFLDADFTTTPADRPGAYLYRAEVPDCAGGRTGAAGRAAAAAGCRLAWFGFPSSPDGMRLHELRQTGPDRVLVDPVGFASAGRWRPGFNTGAGEVTVLHGADWLGAHYEPTDPRNPVSQVRVLSADAPVPVPLVAAGPPDVPQTGTVDDLQVISSGFRPVEVAAGANALPGVGATGFLVDYEYASRLGGDADVSAVYQVWLAKGTPRAVLDQLRDRLTVRGEQTVAGRTAQLLGQGPGQAARLNLLAALIGLVLAGVGIAVIATVERGYRVAELRALRVQGLPARIAAASGLHGYAGLVLGGVLAGVVAAGVSWAATRVVVPAFVDNWTVTPVPVGPRPLTAAAALVLAAAALLGVAVLAARRLAAAVDGPGGSDGGDRSAGHAPPGPGADSGDGEPGSATDRGASEPGEGAR